MGAYPTGREPRNGAAGRQTGTPSGTYPSDQRPDKGYEARSGGHQSGKYPSDIQPRNGASPRETPTGLTPDIPAPRTVEPKATRETPRPNLGVPK